jgi:hypothetical protein
MSQIDEEDEVGDLGQQFGTMEINTPWVVLRPPPRHVRHGRNTSCVSDSKGVGRHAWGEDEPLASNNSAPVTSAQSRTPSSRDTHTHTSDIGTSRGVSGFVGCGGGY